MKPNKVLVIQTIKQVLRWWTLFREGYAYNSKVLGRTTVADDFIKTMLRVVDQGEDRSFIAVLVSGGGDPYGFIACEAEGDRVVIVEIFSNKKCPSTTIELVSEAQAWARQKNFNCLSVRSNRFNSTAIKFFTKQLGFQQEAIVFSKKL